MKNDTDISGILLFVIEWERGEERVVRDKREIVCTAQKGDGVGLHSSIISMNKIKKDFQEKFSSLLLTHSHNYFFFVWKWLQGGHFYGVKLVMRKEVTHKEMISKYLLRWIAAQKSLRSGSLNWKRALRAEDGRAIIKLKRGKMKLKPI